MRIAPLNQNVYNNKAQNVNFGMSFSPKNNWVYNEIVEKTGEYCARLVNTKTAERIIKGTKTDKLLAHLFVAASTVMSSFYVFKTLKNKDMDKDKRRTLALNQGLVYGVSTAMAYTFDKWLTNKFDKLVTDFKAANTKFSKAEIDHWHAGLKVAKSVVIIDTVYRFIAPVIVTPIANAISNKLQDKKQTEKTTASNKQV